MSSVSEEFIVASLPTEVSGHFNVKFISKRDICRLWLPPTGDYLIMDGGGINLADNQTMVINGHYKALLKENGKSIVHLQEVKLPQPLVGNREEFTQNEDGDWVGEELLLVHVGAELLWGDAPVKVVYMGVNDEVCIQEEDGDLSVCITEELRPRLTKEEMLIKELMDAVGEENLHTNAEIQLIEKIIKLGYRPL